MQNTITIVGMGPGGMAYLTMEAFEVLTRSNEVLLRTERHPIVPALVEKGMCYASYDSYYEQFESFEDVYEAIAKDIMEKAKLGDVVYAVPGNPFVAEKTVSNLLAAYDGPIKIVHGTSFVDAIITTLKYDPVNGFVILDALNCEKERFNASKDHLFIQVYDQLTASMLKLKLMEVWGDVHEIVVVRGAGIPEHELVERVALSELDHHPDWFDHLTSVFVPGGAGIKHELHELEAIMRTLRSEDGCPWDREQTHESLTPYLIEEAYEVKEAVDNKDDASLVDELGDVLLQVVFHATMAEEDGYFEMSDIIDAVCSKMIRRHPHVFGDVQVKNSDDVLVNWQAIKDEEKKNKSIAESMKSVTTSLPGLIRAQKVQKKASDVGFDWENASQALAKIHEELSELEQAIENKDENHIAEEMGDLLLIVSNVARLLGLDAEQSLLDATQKFITRFEYVESELAKNSENPAPQLMERMEELWQESKKHYKYKKNI